MSVLKLGFCLSYFWPCLQLPLASGRLSHLAATSHYCPLLPLLVRLLPPGWLTRDAAPAFLSQVDAVGSRVYLGLIRQGLLPHLSERKYFLPCECRRFHCFVRKLQSEIYECKWSRLLHPGTVSCLCNIDRLSCTLALCWAQSLGSLVGHWRQGSEVRIYSQLPPCEGLSSEFQ